MTKGVFSGVLLAVAVGTGACAVENPAAPTVSPFVAQVPGVYTGPITLTDVSGGECVGDILRTQLGATALASVSLNQTGTDVTATLTSNDTGLSCRYSGKAGTATLAFSGAQCEAPVIVYRCANGAVRDAKVVGSSIVVHAEGVLVSGEVTTFYNIYETGKDEGIAGLVTTSTFTAARR